MKKRRFQKNIFANRVIYGITKLIYTSLWLKKCLSAKYVPRIVSLSEANGKPQNEIKS